MLYAVLAAFVLYVLLKRPLGKVIAVAKERIFPSFMTNYFQIEYNRRFRSRKAELLTKGLQRLQERNGKSALNVVEIGAGGGANFEFMPSGVKITCLEPNRKFEYYLRKTASKFPGIELKNFVEGFAEDMSAIPSESADAVTCTLVLCSVMDVDSSVKEILRVLKPGGQFFFMEHVSVDCHRNCNLSRYARVLQKYFCWPWYWVFDCDVTRRSHVSIENAGFSKVQLDFFDAVELVKPTQVMPIVSIMRPHMIGIATK